MADSPEVLTAEAAVFGRALLGVVPDPRVTAEYIRAHQHLPLDPVEPFDRALVSVARRGTWLLRCADGYARLFAPSGVLRRKLSVLVAVLETTSPADTTFRSVERPAVAVVFQLLGIGVGAILHLVCGVVIFAPIQLAGRWGRRHP